MEKTFKKGNLSDKSRALEWKKELNIQRKKKKKEPIIKKKSWISKKKERKKERKRELNIKKDESKSWICRKK